MAFTKIARGDILDIRYSAAQLAELDLNGFDKLAKPTPEITEDGYLYVQVRAISSRVNKNHDGWPSEELAKSYKSFEGRPIFVDHNNDDPTRTRGVVVWSKLHVDDEKTSALDSYYSTAPDNHKPPTWIELLLEVDAKAFPKLAGAIVGGDVDAVSMGANIERSVCSVCENTAKNPSEYCDHVNNKGVEFEIVSSEGQKIRKKAYEDCHDITFFEISFVFDPADETALVSEMTAKTAGPMDMWHDFQEEGYGIPGELKGALTGNYPPVKMDSAHACPSCNSNDVWLHTNNGPKNEYGNKHPVVEQRCHGCGFSAPDANYEERVHNMPQISIPPELRGAPAGDSAPGNFTLNDMGIPPQAENYYRNSKTADRVHHDLVNRGGEMEQSMDSGPRRTPGERALNQVPQSDKTRAPQHVDTMRPDQICPDCGTELQEVQEGIINCAECGYEQPPAGFDNPDLNLAQDMDLPSEDNTQVPVDPNAPTGEIAPAAMPPNNQSPIRPVNPVSPVAGTTKRNTAGSVITDMNWTVKARAFVEGTESEEILDDKLGAAPKKPILNTKKQGTDEPTDQKIVADQLAPVEAHMDKNADREVIKRVEEDGSGVKRTEEITKEFGPLGDDSPDTDEADEESDDAEDSEESSDSEDSYSGGDEDPSSDPFAAAPSITDDKKEDPTTKLMAALRLAKLASEMGVISSEDELDYAAQLEDESMIQIEARSSMLKQVKQAGLSKAKSRPTLASRFPSLKTASVASIDDDNTPDEAIFM